MKLHFSSNVASESALSFDNFSFSLVIQDNDVGEIKSPRTDLVNTAARKLIQFLTRVPRTPMGVYQICTNVRLFTSRDSKLILKEIIHTCTNDHH